MAEWDAGAEERRLRDEAAERVRLTEVAEERTARAKRTAEHDAALAANPDIALARAVLETPIDEHEGWTLVEQESLRKRLENVCAMPREPYTVALRASLEASQWARATLFYAAADFTLVHADGTSEPPSAALRAHCAITARRATRYCDDCKQLATPGTCHQTLHLIRSRRWLGRYEVPRALTLSHRPLPGKLRPALGDVVELDLTYKRIFADPWEDACDDYWGDYFGRYRVDHAHERRKRLKEDRFADLSLHTSAPCSFVCAGSFGVAVLMPETAGAPLAPVFERLETATTPASFIRFNPDGTPTTCDPSSRVFRAMRARWLRLCGDLPLPGSTDTAATLIVRIFHEATVARICMRAAERPVMATVANINKAQRYAMRHNREFHKEVLAGTRALGARDDDMGCAAGGACDASDDTDSEGGGSEEAP